MLALRRDRERGSTVAVNMAGNTFSHPSFSFSLPWRFDKALCVMRSSVDPAVKELAKKTGQQEGVYVG